MAWDKRKTTTIVGIKDVYYALYNETIDAETGEVTGVTYGTPTRLGYTQEIEVSPQTDTVNQYGDNMVVETASSMSNIEVNVTLTGVDPKVEAEILGHTYGNGTVLKNSENIAPFVALMYQRTMANGSSRYVVLYKGQFALPEESSSTKEDSVEFQSTPLTASFLPRHDGFYQMTIDEDKTDDAGATAISNWYKAVPEPSIPTGA